MKFKLAMIGAALTLALGGVTAISAQAPGASAAAAVPQEAAIRKALGERLTGLAKIDEVGKAPIAGLFEVRVGNDIFYTDAEGAYLIRGEILDLKNKRNLTEERVSKLSAIDFASLPLKDAVVWKTGTGARKIAVFADPNCGYCKRFERDLLGVKDVTIYTFLLPILGPDSTAKSRDIWCNKEAAKVWRSWMLDNVNPPKTMGKCDDGALERNVAFGQKHRVNGTPAVFFEDGTRVPGVMPVEQIEKHLAAGKKG